MKFSKCFGLPLCLLFVLLLCSSAIHVLAMDLPEVIDKTNCGQYKNLLFPAMYNAVERGDYVITPGNLNFMFKHNEDFLSASAKNEGKFDISSEGFLIDKATGKYPINLYGFPFPNIDLKDLKAGAKIIQNFNYQRYRLMGSRGQIRVMWFDKSGEERYVGGLDQRLYVNGRPPAHQIENPDNVKTYDMQRVLEPMSVSGTNTMAIVYLGEKEDSNYSYVPIIRRIRKASSTSRSDPYMGSDSWWDANHMWSGKDSSMTWKYVGERTILVSFTSPDIVPAQEMPNGSMARTFPYTGRHFKYGYEDTKWKGASWSPLNITYVPRKVWIVEQMPKDPYYNWGLHINYIDQENFIIWYKEVSDPAGKFTTWATFFTHYSECPSGINNIGDRDASLYINEREHHATSTNLSADPESFVFMPASELGRKYFTISNFLQLSK
ncbi:MAG: DUF1329 domain-containing protein [Proteobacteria bacterium]|nr:DUF1329 domain-containing protein [Pseudomonadota bacterium]